LPEEAANDLRASSSCVEAPATLAGYASDAIGVSSRLADGHVDLSDERPSLPIDARSPAAGSSHADAEIIVVVGGHLREIDRRDTPCNTVRTSAAILRKLACCGVTTADSQPHGPAPPSLGTL